MDEKIFNALNDLGAALDAVAQALTGGSAQSDSVKILQKIDNIDKRFDALANGVKSIKSDTQEILKNQKALQKISSDKQNKTDIFKISGEKKEKIKDGVNSVLMIAAGVLAIGIAFKLIGSVNFLSVIALSIALPLVAIAFEKIAQLKDLNKADLKHLFLITVTMATSIMVASWALALVAPLSIGQGLTAIFIAGTFALISLHMDKIVDATKKVEIKNLWKMPLVLFTVGLSMALASQVMRGIHPISFAQGLTAILIAGTFAVISYGIEKITTGIKNIKPSDIKTMPEVLITLAFSITAASWVMNAIVPISVWQGLTAILIAGVFAVISYGIEKLVKGIKNITPDEAIDMPFILIPVAISIAASSIIMQAIIPITFEQGMTAIGVAAALAIMSLSMPMLAYAIEKTSLKNAAIMPFILPLIALAIVGAAYAFNLMPDIKEGALIGAIEVSLAIAIAAIAVGGAAWVLAKIGVETLVEGGIGILIVAATLMLSSWLISNGNYENYPSLDWAEGVGLSLVAFGISAAALGFIAMTGVGAVALLAGAGCVLALAAVVVGADYILSQGTFGKNYPSLEWSKGVGESLAAFGSILSNMGLGGIALNLIGNLLGTGPVDIAKQMVDVNKQFTGVEFTNYPSLDWANSVTTLMKEFVSISASQGIGDFLSDKLLSSGPESIAKQIVSVDNIFTGHTFGAGIPDGYMMSLSNNIKAYVDLIEFFQL